MEFFYSGYPNGNTLRFEVQAPGRAPVILDLKPAAESWLELPLTLPEGWNMDDELTLVAIDDNEKFKGWIGLAVAPQRKFMLMYACLIFGFVLILAVLMRFKALEKIRFEIIIILILNIILFVIKFSSIENNYIHPDEVIPLKVVENIKNSGKLDTNWKLAELPEHFKYPQYNFSAYIIFCYLASYISDFFIISNMLDLFRFFSLVFSFFIPIATFFLGKIMFDNLTGFISSLITSFSPLLYQDSFYARPESFFTLLTIIFLASVLYQIKEKYFATAFASLIFGLLVSTKVSALLLGPLLMLLFVQGNIQSFPERIKSCLNSAIGSAPLLLLFFTMGFLIGAPYATFNFADYMHGFNSLNSQYSTGHWPHGLIDGALHQRFFYAIDYFVNTHGYFMPTMLFVATLGLISRRDFVNGFILLFFTIFFIRFSTLPVFFERNFSNLVPVLIIFSSYGIIHLISLFRNNNHIINFIKPQKKINLSIIVAIFAALLLSLPSFYILNTITVDHLFGVHKRRVDFVRNEIEKNFNIASFNPGWTKDFKSLSDKFANQNLPEIVEFIYPNDKYSWSVVDSLLDKGYRIEEIILSPFSNIPACTLHTYFIPTTIFLVRDKN